VIGTVASPNGTDWGLSTYRAMDGSHSAYASGGGTSPAPVGGPYVPDQNSWMIYGPFSLADVATGYLSFDLWIATQPAENLNYLDYLFCGFSTDGQHFTGFKIAGNSAGWIPWHYSFADFASGINLPGEAEVWLGFGFISDASTEEEGVYVDNILLTTQSAAPCTLDCSATVPSMAQAGNQVSFASSATATNCSSQPSYSWNFGDGSAVSNSQNPNHVYSAAGSYSWTMTATADGVNCVKNGTIVVSASSANYDREYWVPAAAHAAGNLGSQWRTDLGLFNPGAAAVGVRVDFHNGATVYSLSRNLGPGTSAVLEDVIDQYGVSGAGSLEILADGEVHVTSRTYNQGASGSFGQYLDGIDPLQALDGGQSADLPQLREDTGFRTNVGLLNTSDSNAEVRVELFDGSGNLLTSYTKNLSPGILQQENQPFSSHAHRSDIQRGSARVVVLSGNGVVAYASVIDNQTQDPTTIPMKTDSTEIREGWVAAAAHAAGSQGSQWRTDLGLLNRQASAAQVTITLHAGTSNYTLSRNVGPGVQELLSDVVGMMGVNASGSLEISSDIPVFVTSRTYNEGSSGTFGQFLDGNSPERGISAGQEVYLPQLSENSAFRSNVGMVNTSNSNASVDVVLLSSAGNTVGQFSKTLAPGESWQKNSPFSSVAQQSNLTGGVAKVKVNTGSGIIAYASVVDNQTNDPTTIPMKGAFELGGVFGTVKNSAGSVLSGAKVEASGQSTTTNSQGYYVLDSIPVGPGVAISFSMDGYVPTVKLLRVVGGESNTQDAVLFPAEVSVTISATTGGTVTTGDGASITIPPNSLQTSNGQVYSGNATVTLSSFDPSVPEELDAFPGSFEGVSLSGETVGINTYGFADVTVSSGTESLQLVSGTSANLEIPIPTTLQNEAPSSIPSWHFDPETQIWYEVGTFNKFNNTYRTAIPHFSIWNCDVASKRCYISGRVVDENGDPIKGARMNFRSFRSNGGYVGSAETSTPRDGTFRVPVDANADIEYWASKGHLEGSHSFGHACANNGEMYIGDVVLDTGGSSSIIGITLTWGDEPRDLDAHLAVPLSGGGWEHLYYDHEVGADASLNTDDRDGQGPEIFTINRIHDGVYRYSVHQFAGNGSFYSSDALVSVVGGGVSYRSYEPPGSGAVGSKDLWFVFDLDCLNQHCTISRINTYSHSVDSSDDSAFEP